MSTLKSSAEDLTLNADGSGNDIIFQSNGSNVATLDQAGLLTATSFAGSGASLTGLVSTVAGATDATVSASEPVATSNPSAVGHLWINSTSGESYICTDATTNSNVWTNVGDGGGAAGGVAATGGAEVISFGGYKYHIFTSTANFIVTTAGNVDYLIIAGGGSGGGGATNSCDATANTGSGGGGIAQAGTEGYPASSGSDSISGAGGSGIIIIRYEV